MKILAIDDRESQLAALSEMLRTLIPDCEVTTAASWKAGLELARTFQPDTIILDVIMPGMNGFEVCEALKRDSATRHIPVIFLTGQATDPASRIRGLEIGGGAFLTHPIEAGELISQVRAMVRIKRAEDALRAENISTEGMLRQTKERQAAILHTARDGFFILDLQGRFLDVNEAACQMTGYSREELLRLTISDLEADESPAEIAAQFGKIKQAGAALFERRHRCKDGRIIHVEVSANYLPDTHEQMFAFIRDITARKRAEEAQAQLATVVEQADETIVITDTQGTILYVNPAFEKITGYTRAEALGQNSKVLKSGKQDEAFYKKLWDTILAGNVWHGHFSNRRKDGTFYEEEATISPVRAATGKIVNFVATKRDVTHETELEAQFRQSQKMEAFGQLAGGVAHDFNNILTVIQGNAELMKLAISEAEKRELLQQILLSSNRAAELVRQLLALSRRQVMHARPVDLNVVVAGMGKMLQRLIGENIMLQTRLLPGTAPVQADPGMIEQVLLNLAVNARDAMPKGGQLDIMLENITVNEAAAGLHLRRRPGGFIRLSVQDNGHGMAPEILSRIFEPFFTTKDVGKGTGLGLATVDGIAAQHQGWVEVESQVGKGTTFHLYLPRLPVAQVLPEAQAPVNHVRGGHETILLAEDELAVRKLVTHTLEKYGYQVVEANSGTAAMKIWPQHRDAVDLLLTDIIMPDGISGSELAVQLQASKPDLQVIYISGYPGEVAGRGLDLHDGVNFLQKPFSPETLARTVRNSLDDRRKVNLTDSSTVRKL